jgi:hypothetical protein
MLTMEPPSGCSAITCTPSGEDHRRGEVELDDRPDEPGRDRGGVGRGLTTGVVDQHVESTEAVDAASDRLDLRAVPDVGRHVHAPVALLLGAGRGRHVDSVQAQVTAGGLINARLIPGRLLAATGDDDDPARELLHCRCLLVASDPDLRLFLNVVIFFSSHADRSWSSP